MDADREALIEIFLQRIQTHQLGLLPDDMLVVANGGTRLCFPRRQLMHLVGGFVDEG